MKNSAALKRQMRYQQWVEEVKDLNARPKELTANIQDFSRIPPPYRLFGYHFRYSSAPCQFNIYIAFL